MLLYCDGMDSYSTIADSLTKKWTYAATGAGNWTFSATGGVKGGGGLRCEQDDVSAIVTFREATGTSTRVRFAYWFRSTGAPGATDDHFCIVSSSNTAGLNCRIQNDGNLVFYGSDSSYWATIGSVKATTTGFNLHDGGWHFIQVHAFENGASGSLQVYIDGTTAVNFAGDIAWTTNASLNLNHIDQIHFRAPDTDCYIDDVIVWDDVAGDSFTGALTGTRVIETIRPTANGTTNQFTRNTGATNYEAIDDATAHDVDVTYVSSSTAGHKDLYAYSNLTITPLAITGVAVSMWAKTMAGATSVLRARARNVATEVNGTSFTTAAASYNCFQTMFTTDPNTSTAWTEAGVNSAEFGFEVVS